MRTSAPASNVWIVTAVPRSRTLFALDGAAGLVLGGLLTAAALTIPREHLAAGALGPAWLAVLVSWITAGTVVLRRIRPTGALATAAVCSALSWAIGLVRDPYIAVALVLYILASTRPPRRSALALALCLCLTVAMYLTARPALLSGSGADPIWSQMLGMSVTASAIEAVGWTLGVAVYRQRSYLDAVRREAAQQVHAQRVLAERAAAQERMRIARELHDVVAHAMSVITVQAGVARYILPGRPEQAAETLETIEATGRLALQDMRRLLGVLREEDESSPRAPAPTLAELGELTDRMQASGTRVELTVRGHARPLPEGLELSAYRIVQEALTNVAKHAATDHARVVLDYGPDELGIEVLDDGVGAAAATGVAQTAGHGLVGMRERAALHGGVLESGPLPVRGYRVAARLPAPAFVAHRPA
jgi:signal transduction histidine kinase